MPKRYEPATEFSAESWRVEPPDIGPHHDGAIFITAERHDEIWEQIREDPNEGAIDGRELTVCLTVDDWIAPFWKPELQRLKAIAALIAAAPDMLAALKSGDPEAASRAIGKAETWPWSKGGRHA
jgi:hypothetical protein